ncbi:MAG: hypothetical protein JNK78_07490 [Planctomycetes bacterium]|nr:hypothetical protein [Planctomycetota bacterium]
MVLLRLLATSLLFACLLPAQDLRRGLVDADFVAVARAIGKKEHDADLVLHRLQVIRRIRGDEAQTVTVLDWPNLALHARPMIRQSRLYCLQDASAQATRLGLPAADGPYFKMVGWSGSNPLVGENVEGDPNVQFAALLARSEAGTPPTETAADLCSIALLGAPGLRTEAARFLAERPTLRAKITELQWSRILTRTSGEIDDVAHKIALAELCAEQGLPGLLDSLAVSLGQVQDAEYARTVGRIGALLHGEDATTKLEERLRLAGQEKDRAALLLAIGATNTSSALEALLRIDSASGGKDAAVEAALREHRSPRAKEAVARRK